MGLSIDEQKAVERFQKQVVEPSQTKLVVVDFWAEWCGPCKALAPVIEKVCAEYADKGVVLAKVNVDEEKFIASQFQVQSIPTVYAMFQGQPVADLSPARSESQLKGALDQILAQLPIKPGGEDGTGGEQLPDLDQLVAMAEQMLGEGDAERAAQMFMQIAQMDNSRPEVFAGLIRALLAAGHKEHAEQAYEGLPQEMKDEAVVQQAYSALELAGPDVDDSELQAKRAMAAEQPAAMDVQMEFAEAAFAAGSRDEAAEVLLRMIEADPAWNEGAAKAKLLQIFEAVGLEDPWVAGQRRKLSLLLFG
ncbi:tetratricopeptide repeat protein [Alteraurantiacibacter aquimixticola]|uniref:Tetratricopeptide repeat protein n=1 Tax=Alteraurantiacibacter aquimixticola TaxID=2489173 RepID=A0A4T3EZG9_9SPHN|nr:tetratricopeptide repeat protein [Alteraurantiacibacter aquimixticola]TIX49279.1 tetratricopeptide repeat protein [Alteraurantiacibacter aquimixticola]